MRSLQNVTVIMMMGDEEGRSEEQSRLKFYVVFWSCRGEEEEWESKNTMENENM